MRIKTFKRFFWPGLFLSTFFLISLTFIAHGYPAGHSLPSNTVRGHSYESAGERVAALRAGGDESTETIYPTGRWEGETSLTAEDVRKLKNWPETLMEWLNKVWSAFVEWFKKCLGHR